jgi:hypothetical protein
MRGIFQSILCAVGLATQSVAVEPGAAAYGTKVTFREGQALRFPNFELVYTGKRKVTPPQYPRGWWAYDFQVLAGKEEQKISWSAGTGDIGPTRFTIAGSAYDLELSRSDKLGRLKDDELVVSRAK